jgi:hypothetical protein
VTVPLRPPFLHARDIFGNQDGDVLVTDQPTALSDEDQQQPSRQNLRRAEPFPSEKRTHRAKRLFYHVWT